MYICMVCVCTVYIVVYAVLVCLLLFFIFACGLSFAACAGTDCEARVAPELDHVHHRHCGGQQDQRVPLHQQHGHPQASQVGT